MGKTKKLFIGISLFIGFILYTKYEETMGSTMRIDPEMFEVVESWDDLAEAESSLFPDLKFPLSFDLFEDSNITIPLEGKQRVLKIEKRWGDGTRFCLIYSVDIKRRDKDEQSVPSLSADTVRLTLDDGQEIDIPAVVENSPSEGFVLKNRLYRSMIITPEIEIEKFDAQPLLDKIKASSRIELKGVTMAYGSENKHIQQLAFKLHPNKPGSLPDTIGKYSMDKELSLQTGNQVRLQQLEVFETGARIKTDQKLDSDIIGFIGEINEKNVSTPTYYRVFEDEKGTTYLENNSILHHLLNIEGTEDRVSFTFTHVVKKSKNAYSFSVLGDDIETMYQQNKDVLKEELVTNEHGNRLFYKGLVSADGVKQGTIKLQLEKEDDLLGSYSMLQPSSNEEGTNHMNDKITIQDRSGKYIEDFIIVHDVEEGKEMKTIHFANGIPEGDLKITVSNLTYIEPLKIPVENPLEWNITHH
ncbi:hypothetical protein EV282_3730 [Fictibacillus sp. BK138]|nr:hypothetical protein EV282_3730 [Fictibacillus sp. BK138]